MKKKFPLRILIAIILIGCGHASSKADSKETAIEKIDSVTATPTPKISNTVTNNNTATKPAQARGPVEKPATGANDILANIDKHLLSTPQYTTLPGGGFTNCTITITNTLKDATFQKAIVEVNILNEDDSKLRTDLYTVINIESRGGSKLLKIPDNNKGAKIVTHIVKVRSTELTNGESVVTGSNFVAN